MTVSARVLFVLVAGTMAEAPAKMVDPYTIRLVDETNCEHGKDADSIIICGRGSDRNTRFRILNPNAGFDPEGNTESVASERSQWIEGGEAGTGSCSSVGPGGWTGCLQKQWCKQQQQSGSYCRY